MLSKVCAGALLRDKSDRLGLHLVHGGGLVLRNCSRGLSGLFIALFTLLSGMPLGLSRSVKNGTCRGTLLQGNNRR